ncbi:type I secretion system permease/ATPase [Pseudorhodoferax soli]|uniref:Cyclolysin secretion/processing ATP-binding protein CyaB n=1 Tax=Pseudorhodoferax soli TaxID=545864 RepID=A0A368XUA0_9BURK|nr:type I secretion system permease/ATPase [Pseudorhodoferax soli]RCW71465.1 ATP-binding cassette subfamily C protein LapB [Pseudorhodoferax soli]
MTSPSMIQAVPPAEAPLLDGIAFLARYFGTAVERSTLQEAARGSGGADDLLAVCAARAGLACSPLPAGEVRATMLPALVRGGNGRVLVALQREGDRFECHVPGVQGSHWLDLAQLQAECPGARWHAVRPALFFDQRSLLYTLPSARRWFWDVFGRNRWIFGWALLGTLALNLFGALIPFFSMAVYDRVVPNNALGSLWVLTLAAVLLIGFELAMKLLRSGLLESAARRMDLALSSALFAQCLRLRAATRPASGGVLANVVRDFESVRDFFASGTLAVLGDLPFLLLFLGLIVLIGGWLVVVPLAMIVLMLASAWLLQKPLARQVASSTREGAQRTAHLFETMNALDTVKSLGAEAWSRRKWEQLTVAIAHSSLKTRELVNLGASFSTSAMGLSSVLLVTAGAVLIGEQALTLGQLIGVTMLSGRAMTPVAQIASLMVRWQQTRLSLLATDQIMAAATDDAGATLHAPPLRGALELREVHFAYPQRPALLDRLSLRIRPGERVGFIGKLGSGKSTLLKLVLNLHQPSSGSVLVDDLVTTQLDALSLRRQIGYVPQDVTLFHGTVRENIEMGRTDGGDAALMAAIRSACLDETLAQLPAGAATQVGERGELLSGGQRQAVAIARALLPQPRLLLLDEPSSMMDPATEQRLIGQLRALPDTTLLLVTHRMAMLPLVDRLVVMDRGRVVADGPRDQVLRALAQNAGAVPAHQQAAG